MVFPVIPSRTKLVFSTIKETRIVVVASSGTVHQKQIVHDWFVKMKLPRVGLAIVPSRRLIE